MEQVERRESDRKSKQSEWVHALQSLHCAEVEQRIVRQLIETLVYENIIARLESVALQESEGRFKIEGITSDGQAVAYVCRGKRKDTFARIRLTKDPVLRVGPSGDQTNATISEFVSEVLGQLQNNDALGMFMEELVQTLLKDTQAQMANPIRQLSGVARSYDELEGNIMDGHPYHPCYKSRIGFTLEDNAAYGPEFKPKLKPVWVAVVKAECELAVSRTLDYAAYMSQELGDAVYARFVGKIMESGNDPDDYVLIAVHPWQWREAIIPVYYRQLAEGRMILLGEGEDDYRPQQSIRTLANTLRHKAYLKLPLNITNTSTGRILAQHTIMNAPLISDWLYDLIERDAYAKRLGFVVLREVAGASYNHEVLSEIEQERAYGMLGTIWRESLHTYMQPGDEAAPFNALCHTDRSGQPFIDPWIQKFGAEEWTRTLLRISVTPIIHLLYAHGVALESHAQNMILIHREGWPARLALKDFHDGVRFSRSHLANPSVCPTLHPAPVRHAQINRNSFIETDDAAIVRDFVHDAFFFINLSELCMFLEERYGLDESHFWSMAAQVIHDYQHDHPEHRERYACFDLFAESIQVEQLTKRRLFGDGEFRLHTVPNPLYRFR